jgi:hypothetical protein
MIALLFSLFFLSSHACDFSSEIKSVYSLSGPVSLAFKSLGLDRNTKLKGVSVYHPLDSRSFKGDFLPGGVFLSPESLQRLSGSLVFYDESRELTKILSKTTGIKAIEIRTRQMHPLEVMAYIQSKIAPFLSNCDEEKLSSRVTMKLANLKTIIKERPTMVFFLGRLQREKLPQMVMVQDGVVKWMNQEGLIKTYPSPLAYVSWSSKILRELPKDTLKVGIMDSGNSMEQKIEKLEEGINLTFPGSLIPGEGQVDAMIYLFGHL